MKRVAASLAALTLASAAAGATGAAFSSSASNGGNSFTASATFLGFVKNVGSASCGGTSDSVTVPAAGVAMGNTLVVRAGFRDNSTISGFTPTVTDSQGNTYTNDADRSHDGASVHVRSVTFSAHISTALVSGDTITLSHPTIGATAMSVSEYTGVAPSGRVDQTGSAIGASSTPSASVTTTNTYDLLLGNVAAEATGTATQPGGWSALPTVSVNCGGGFGTLAIHGGYQIVAATGTYTYNPVLSSSSNWAEVVAAYQ